MRPPARVREIMPADYGLLHGKGEGCGDVRSAGAGSGDGDGVVAAGGAGKGMAATAGAATAATGETDRSCEEQDAGQCTPVPAAT